METSRERVLKAIRHVEPEIIPVNIGGIYGFDRWQQRFGVGSEVELRRRFNLDIEYARPVYKGSRLEQGLGIWGTPVDGVFSSDGAGYASERGGYPLQECNSIAEIEAFPWPSPDDFDYSVIVSVLRKIPDDKAKRVDGKYGLFKKDKNLEQCAQAGPWVPLLCTLFDLFGLEETLINFHWHPDVMEAAVRHIEEFTVEFARRSMEAGRGLADIYFYGDDFSTQNGLMISPELWRKFLRPTYQKVFALAKSMGYKVWFHSCGTFRPVLGDLVDCGMDVWETVQAHLPGNEPEDLKRHFGKHLTFYGAISTQHTLPNGTPEQVRAEVRERIRILGEGGGYICGSDHGIMPDVPIDNVLALIDEARRFRRQQTQSLH